MVALMESSLVVLLEYQMVATKADCLGLMRVVMLAQTKAGYSVDCLELLMADPTEH
jgi:hypothetical protein